jgi:hypothetical protein
VQVVWGCLRFAALAEAFAAGKLPTRDAFMHILGAFVRGSHKSNMQALKQALAAESWGAAAARAQPGGTSSMDTSSGPDASCMQHSLASSAYLIPAFGADGFVGDFGDGSPPGNPFRKQGRTAGGVLGTRAGATVASCLMKSGSTPTCPTCTRQICYC